MTVTHPHLLEKASECWHPIPGYEGFYEITENGDVRRVGGNELTKSATKTGYLHVTLSRCGVGRSYYIQQLVLLTFVGPKKTGQEACHLDGNRKNNSRENLIWGTHLENEAHKVAHGTVVSGSKQGLSKLTEDQVRLIKARLSEGSTLSSLADEYGVHFTAISQIKRGLTWRHVPGPTL